MSQVKESVHSDEPGMRPTQIFEYVDDHLAAKLLPDGAFRLIEFLGPKLLKGLQRAETLGKTISIELAVVDQGRRSILLNALPKHKATELEHRLGKTISALCAQEALETATRRDLLGFFGKASGSDEFIEVSDYSKTIAPRRTLFPHQKRAAMAVEKYLYFEDGRVILHLPTGVGKTRTAMSIIATHLRSYNSGIVLWLAATRELLEQAWAEFDEAWKVAGDEPIDSLRHWGSYEASFDDLEHGVVFAGLAKLRSYGSDRSKLWSLGDRTTMVVFDEAHQAIARTYQDLVDTIVTRRSRTALLGLTATPGRTWGDSDEDTAVADLFFGNKVMIDLGNSNPIRALTQQGYLASVRFSLLNSEKSFELSTADFEEVQEASDIPDRLLEKVSTDEQRNLQIIQKLLSLAKQHARILVFAPSVENAVFLASICRGLGLIAHPITGETDTNERRSLINRFKRSGGPGRILINYGVLTTGFDAPAASAALIARPTKSLVLYSQMVGRVIRGPKAGGTEECEVVTVVDTSLPGFGDVAEAFLNWEDIWNLN